MAPSEVAKIIKKIENLNLGIHIQRTGQFFDEPRFFAYTTFFKISRKRTDGMLEKEMAPGSGFSLDSPIDALFKSVCEEMERFSLYCYRNKDIKLASYKRVKDYVDPASFSKNPDSRKAKLGWIKGVDLFTGQDFLLPAQLVYLNYKRRKTEPYLEYPHNTSGAAGGSSLKQAILHGIYELVERDAFMNVYLNKIRPLRVDLSSINNSVVKSALEKSKRYKLDLHVLDITTDLGIPSYLAILIDKTGLGPAVSLGAKSSLNTKTAIIGAITECFMTRQFVKSMIRDGSIFQKNPKKHRDVLTIRAGYWLPQDKIGEINFLLSAKSKKVKLEAKKTSTSGELKSVLQIIKSAGLRAYYVDATFKDFKDLGFFTCKVLIPSLQPLYLHEKEKEKTVDEERLKKVADFFGQKYTGVNPIPHPFL